MIEKRTLKYQGMFKRVKSKFQKGTKQSIETDLQTDRETENKSSRIVVESYLNIL